LDYTFLVPIDSLKSKVPRRKNVMDNQTGKQNSYNVVGDLISNQIERPIPLNDTIDRNHHNNSVMDYSGNQKVPFGDVFNLND
jgi:hypothetical protein